MYAGAFAPVYPVALLQESFFYCIGFSFRHFITVVLCRHRPHASSFHYPERNVMYEIY